MSTQTLSIQVPANEWITSNGRYHWAAKAKRTARVRYRACMLARNQLAPVGGVVRVTATIHGRTGGRFDPANAYPTVKALIDGLTDAGIWPDDDSRHLIGPDMRRGERIDGLPAGWHQVTLTIEESKGAGHE